MSKRTVAYVYEIVVARADYYVERPLKDDGGHHETMTLHLELIYRSQNRDVWHLFREASGRILVQHTANAGFSGNITDGSIEEFLSINGAESCGIAGD